MGGRGGAGYGREVTERGTGSAVTCPSPTAPATTQPSRLSRLVGVARVGVALLIFAAIIYAIASGALTSGIGYVIWYAALPSLKATTAATVQLSVPVLAALGGVLFLGEHTTPRLLIATVAILGGIALVVFSSAAASSARE